MYSIPQSEKAMVMMTGSSSICEEAIPPKSTASSSANVPEPFLVRGWDPLISMAQNMDFDVSTALPSCNVGVVENQGISRFSCLSSGNFSDIMSSFTLLESSQLPSALCPIDFPTSDEKVMEKDSKGKKRRRMPECCDFDSQSPLNRTQNAEAERKDVSPKNVKDLVENDEIKQQAQINLDVNTRKITSKQSKEHSLNGDAPKEEYLHVRAKRGQATNSHSLAERVRREKISERMRYLQDLVPGCNKITGKAVMLDEIINYVQSLQRQVEVPEAFNVFDAQPVISDGFAQVSNKGGITVICSKRGGNASTNNHNEWLLTVPLVPDVINFTFIPIISLVKDVLGKGFLAHAINLYLRYKPPISELEYFLDFQYHKIWAPTLNEHPLGPCSNRSLPTLALHFNLMGPKLYVNTTQVDGLISIMESENVGPFNLGNPGEFTMQDSYFH